MQEKGESFAEYERRKIIEMQGTAAQRQRQQRKAIRTAGREKIPALALSSEGDALLFDGQAYSLFYAHGNLQVERSFATQLRKSGYSSSVRQEIHKRVKSLVAASSLSCNILGQPA